jgi:small subunit ribosomal protein S11
MKEEYINYTTDNIYIIKTTMKKEESLLINEESLKQDLVDFARQTEKAYEAELSVVKDLEYQLELRISLLGDYCVRLDKAKEKVKNDPFRGPGKFDLIVGNETDPSVAKRESGDDPIEFLNALKKEYGTEYDPEIPHFVETDIIDFDGMELGHFNRDASDINDVGLDFDISAKDIHLDELKMNFKGVNRSKLKLNKIDFSDFAAYMNSEGDGDEFFEKYEAPVKITTGTKAEIESKGVEHPFSTIHVHAGSNNTHATISFNGEVKFKKSCGALGFKGAKRSLPYASEVLGEALGKWLKQDQPYSVTGLDYVPIEVEYTYNGIGAGKEGVLRGLASQAIPVLSITDVTQTAHGGIRGRKVRRI